MTHNHNIDVLLCGLLLIDLVLTGYGIWAFRAAQKSCKAMLEKLVADHKH